MSQNIYKIVLVGKTTYIRRLLSGEFKEYVSTVGIEVNVLRFKTNKGQVIFNVWDCSGVEKFHILHKDYYSGADAVIVMCSHLSKKSFENIERWVKGVKDVSPNAYVVVCGNKVDVGKITKGEIEYPYCDISVRSNYNFEKPFLFITQNFMGDEVRFI